MTGETGERVKKHRGPPTGVRRTVTGVVINAAAGLPA